MFKSLLAALLFAVRNGSAVQIAIATYLQYSALTPDERKAKAAEAVKAFLGKRAQSVDPAIIALIVDFAIAHLPKSKGK